MTDINTVTTPSGCLILIDSRVTDYQEIVNATQPGVRHLVFNVEDTSNVQNPFEYIQTRIAELGVSAYTSVGLVQHNTRTPRYSMFGQGAYDVTTQTPAAPDAIIVGVETSDPTLQTWSGVAGFITALKTNYGIQNFDMMACALYSDANWKYVIDTLTAQTGVTIRASTDDTGAAGLGGDWFLESHTGVNLKGVYFTEAIEDYRGVLGASDIFNKFLIDLDGNAWGAGQNSYGSLGIGIAHDFYGSNSYINPVKVINITGTVVKISQGYNSTIFLTSDGNVWSCGGSSPYTGTVGHSGSSTPVKISSLGGGAASTATDIIDINATTGQGMALLLLKQNGTLLGSGSRWTYQGSGGLLESINTDTAPAYQFVPYLTVIPGYSNTNITAICGIAGSAFGLLTRNGVLSAPGSNYQINMSNVRTFDAVYDLVLILKTNGTVYTCGYNVNGELGLGHSNTTNTPELIPNTVGFTNTDIIAVAVGDYYGLFLKSNGSVYSCGNGEGGRLGLGNQTSVTTPTLITALNGINIVAISAKARCSYFMSANGKVYTCGTGNNGQLFQGYITSTSTIITTSLTPTMISGTWKNLGNSIPTLSNFPDSVTTSSFTLTPPSSTSRGSFTYRSSNLAVATVNSGGIVTIVSIGNTSITATQDASGIYDARSITALLSVVNPVTTVIEAFIVPAKTYGTDTSFNLTDPSSNNTGGAFTFTSGNTSVATISGRTVTIVGPGTSVITATQAAAGAYTAASTTASFTVNLPTVFGTFTVPAKTYGTDTTFNLTDPTSNNTGGAFTFTSSNTQVATISGRTVTIVGPGASVITATQAASGNYGAASTTASLVVGFGNVSSITRNISDGGFVIPTPLSNVPTTYGTGWNKLGADMTSESYSDYAYTASVSADGTVVAIGAHMNDGFQTGTPYDERGHVRVYKYTPGKNYAVTNQDDLLFGPVGWTRLGADIDGEAADDRSGYSVSISADGTTVAIGAIYNDGAGNNAGQVRVYKYTPGKAAVTNQNDLSFGPVGWTRLGADIDGEAANDECGSSVSLSADGTVVAIGAKRNDGSGNLLSNSGHVRVYKYTPGKAAVTVQTDLSFGPIGWTRLGADIDGEAAGDWSGSSVSLSADGTVVAIGAQLNDGTSGTEDGSADIGHVRVYKYTPSKTVAVTAQSDLSFGPIGWTRLGVDIDGEAVGDGGDNGNKGIQVSLSADGTTVAIGAYSNDGTTGIMNDNRGRVRVFKYIGPIGWTRLGANIDGEYYGDYTGYRVSLSADGTMVAIGSRRQQNFVLGASDDRGVVRVYKYTPSKTVAVTVQTDASFGPIGWTRIGANIYGETGGDQLGESISLSADGTTVAIGVYANNGGTGHVRVYRIDTSGNYTYTIGNSAIADICGNIVLPKSGGSTTITATQSASGGNTSKTASIPLLLLPITPTYQTYTITSKTFSDAPFGLVDPSSNSPGAFTFTSSNASVATISGRTVTITGAGTTTITATQAASGDYATGSVTASFTVNPVSSVIGTFTVPAKTYGDASFNLADPTSNNTGGAFTYTSGNTQVATISGRTVTIIGPGTSVITASQAAAGNYTVTTTTASFVVAFGNQSSLNSKVITDGPIVLATPLSNVATTYGTTWNQLGADIIGKVAGDESGTSISVSADGTIIAIGARSNTSNRGTVRVYKYNDISWNQLGSDINGEATSDYSGQSVSLSANGTILAIGANMNDGSGNLLPDSGHVRIYEFNGSSWVQRGGDIDGEVNTDQSGYSVSLSADGNTVAIGAIMNDGSGNALSNSGHVRVYKYNALKTSPQLTNQSLSTFGPAGWDRLGGDIDGEAVNDQSGFSVGISANGTIVAIGAILNDGTSGTIDTGDNRGHVRIYKYNSSKTEPQLTNQGLATFGPAGWDRMGSDIDGEAAADQTGFSISLSADGSAVAIGAPLYDASGSNSGRVRVFAWNGTSWGQRGGNINGVNLNENTGDSVSLSADGTILSVGSFMKVANYSYNSSTNTWSQIGTNVTGTSTSTVSISKNVLSYSPIVYLDATNSSSYNGTTWTNLGSLGGNVNIPNNMNLSTIYNLITPYLSELKNSNFYEYGLDGNSTYITDGGGDMYDTGNYTTVYVDGVSSSNLSYSDTTPVSVTLNGKTISVISLGYSTPLVMLANCGQRATIGMKKSGGLGADGTGGTTTSVLYNGQTVNGYTVYAWFRLVYGAGDPSIGDLYFAIGDTSTTFYPTGATSGMNTFASTDTNLGDSYMTIDCQNALVGTILLSKGGGVTITISECQSVLFNLTNRLISTNSNLPRRFDSIDNGGSFNFNGSTNSEILTVASTSLSQLTFVSVVKTTGLNMLRGVITDFGSKIAFSTGASNTSTYSSRLGFKSQPTPFFDQISSFALTANVWYFVAVTFTSSGLITIYVNGTSVFIAPYSPGPTTWTGTTFGIGADSVGADKWNGKISSLAVYNTALTATEIANLYNIYETYRVSLSSQGNIVAIGAREYDGVTGTSTNIGVTRVYRIDTSSNYTYTIGNSAIADICGNIVLPKSIGSTTITVTQAASGVNTSKSATVPLTLSYAPTFQPYTIASKTFGDAPFDLTDPSSNSPGTFTYTSGNTLVATISGRTVTIVGPGMSVITASQAAAGNYGAASTTASLVVAFGNLSSLSSKLLTDGPFVIPTPLSNVLTTYGTTWNQLGADILGKVAGDESGTSISVSADGTIVAIGARSNTSNRGTVRVYKYNDISWNQLGSDINGKASSDYSGQSVSLSANGTILAIGANMNDGSGNLLPDSGHVRIYEFNGSSWVQRGGDIDGEVGSRVTATSTIGTSNWFGVAMSATGQYQTAVARGGQINISSNYGINWAAVDISRNWGRVSLSSTGQYQTATLDSTSAQIYISTDFGNTWTPKDSLRLWGGVSLSSTGQYQTGVVEGGQIYISLNYGNSWSPVDASRNWYKVSLSSTGQYQSAVVWGGGIYTSSNYGSTWALVPSANGPPTNVQWGGISVSSTGQYQSACAVNESSIYVSTNFGASFTAITVSSGNWFNISVSSTGQYQTANLGNGLIYVSSNFGARWNATTTTALATAMSYSGQYQTAARQSDVIYFSSDYGVTWNDRASYERTGDQSGISVSLSEDGNIVAIGAIMNDGSGNALSNSGHVRVYKYNSSKTSPQLTNQDLATFGPAGWDRLGGDIDGEAVGDQSGFSVGISGNGTIVAIGAILNDGTSGTVDTSNNRGHVRVYRYNASKTDPQLTNQGLTTFGPAGWDRMGSDIDGEVAADQTGFSISLSADGSAVAIGAPLYDASGVSNSGRVRVFEWNGTAWGQRGGNINGVNLNENVGDSVSLSADGSILSVGSFMKVINYNYNSTTNTWSQIGANITGASVTGSGITNALAYSPHVYLDATNPTSYNRSTNTWTNIGSLGGNVVMTNMAGTFDASDNGGSFNFNGTSNYGQLNITTLSLTQLTYVAVVKTTEVANWSVILTAGYWNPVLTKISSSAMNFYSSTPYASVNSSFNFMTNTWYVVAATYSPTGVVNFYVNGAFVSTSTIGTNASWSVSTFVIGADTYASYKWTGKISSLAVYNRALTATEIANLNNYQTYRVSLSSQGNIVAIGAREYDGVSGALTNIGATRVYKIDTSGNYTYTSSNSAIADICGNIVLPKSVGSTTITVIQAASGVNTSKSTTVPLTLSYAPTFQPYTIADVSFGVSPFSLTPPTTDSSGAFSYVSNTPLVATVTSGGVVTVVKAGTATFTLTQEASGNYLSGTKTATLTVRQIAPTITWTITDVSFGVSPFSLTPPTTDSSGGFGYQSSNTAVATFLTIIEISHYNGVYILDGNTTNNNPTINLVRGFTYSFNINASGHPFLIKTIQGTGTNYQYSTGVTNNGTAVGTINFTVPLDAPSTLYYNCQYHSSMQGTILITNNGVSSGSTVNTVIVGSAGTSTITATQAATTNYTAGSVTAALVVSPITPTYQAIAQITKTYSTDVSFSLTSIMAGVSNSSGTYSFSSASNAIDICGGVATILAYTPSAITITASQAAYGNYNATGSKTFTLLVNRKTPSYGPFSIPAKTYGDAPFSVVQYAPTTDSLSVPFTYTSSDTNVATINSNGTVVTIIGQGYTTITASQEANGNYAANSTTTSFLVNRAAPTFLKAFTITDKTFGDASFSLLPFTEGLDNTDGTYHFTSSNAELVSISNTDNVTAIIHAYTPTPITIYVAIDACGNYAASSTSGTLNVSRATPTIGPLTVPTTKKFRDTSFNLTAPTSDSSGGVFSYTSSNTSVATVTSDGGVVTIVGAGSTTITATQAVSGNYTAGSVTAALVVSPIAPTIRALTIPAKNFGDASFNLTAPTTDSSGAFIYTSSDPTVATVTSSGGTITILKVGNTTITATQDACGNFISGNVSASLVVSASLSNFTVPAKNYTDAAFDLTNPTSTDTTVGFTFASSNTAVATIGGAGGRTVSIVGVGSSVITATQAATENRGELNITATLVVSPIRPVITLAPITKAYGNSSFRLAPSSTNTDTSGGNVFTFSSSNIAVVSFLDASLVRINGVGPATIAITQAASANFTDSSGSVVITVNKGASGFSASTFAVAANKTYGDASFAITTVPTSYSTGALTYSSSNEAVATIDPSGVIRLVGFGTVNFTALQAESILYTADTKVSNNLSVARKTVALTRDTPSGSTITKTYGDANFTVSATNESNGAFSYESSDASFATVDASSGLVHIVAVGTTTITATRAQTAQYVATSVSWTLQINRGTTTLTGLSSLTRNVTVTPFTVSASNASNGAVSYALQDPSSTVLTIHPTSGLVTLLSPGSAVIVASQAQGTLYEAPSSITATITVTAAANTLQGATLTNSSSFANVDLSGASLANSNITNTNFSSSRLGNSNFNNSTISGANMTSTDLSGSSLTTTNITNTNFTSARLGNSNFNNSTISGTNMTGADLSGASLTTTNITNTNFTSARLGNSNFNNSTISGSTMTSADLSGATMISATITGTDFTSAILRRTDLSGANVRSSIFNSADLSGSTLTHLDASGASFINANLKSANLSNAVFTNANMTNANISGANISNVTFTVPQKLQLLKNTDNRPITDIQVSQVVGSTLLPILSAGSAVRDLPNVATATFKVMLPITSLVTNETLTDTVLDITNFTYFYFPIGENEYFQIQGVKYYISGNTVRNYATNAVVENSTYGVKAIRLIAGSLTIVVNSQNTLPASSFVVPSTKINTDAPFGVITAPTSNSSAPIVYASTNTSIATIHPSTGLITLVGDSGFVRFTASQVLTETHEAASITSNEMFVNRLIDLTLPGLNQTFTLSTLASLDASSIAVETTDATAVFYVRLSDMTELFQYQTDSFDINDISSSDLKYYVFHRKWPAELKINPSHAMMNKTESAGMLGGANGYTADKSLVKHDFVRYIALRLFYTIHGVDLFRNETDLLENISYLGDTVQNNIDGILSGISTTSSSATMSYDASGNKYLTNDTSGNMNLCRELMRQIAASDPSRLYNNGANNAGLKNVPLRENDSILFKLTITSAIDQNALTGVSVLPSRTYTIKLVLKNTVTSVTNANTVVTDSEMYPNSYAYSTSVVTYGPTTESSSVYNVYSPPAPIPFSRFGYNGWYYTNSTAWVNVAQSVRDRVKWIVPANTVGSSTVGELRYIRINMKVFNKTSLPYLVVYTQAGSYRKYTFATPNSLVNGTVYSFYMNLNSYSREPAMIGSTNAALTYSGVSSGSFANNEVVTSIAVESDNSAAAGSVEFTLASVVVGEFVSATSLATEKEYGFSAEVPVSYP